MTPGSRVSLVDRFGADGLLEESDGYLVVVGWWRVAVTCAWAWLWPTGVVAVLGAGVLVVRGSARERLPVALGALAVAGVIAVAAGTLYPRTVPTGGFQRLCWLVVTTGGAGGELAGARRPSRVVSLVVLPSDRGLALVGGTEILSLREAGIAVELLGTRRGRVSTANLTIAGRATRAAAYGRLPRSLSP